MSAASRDEAHHWWILLTDDGRHVLPQAQTFTERAPAERAQLRRAGSRLKHIVTP
jgi:hypothetical protein